MNAKRHLYLLIISCWGNLIYSQNIRDSLERSFLPNASQIIANKIVKIEFTNVEKNRINYPFLTNIYDTITGLKIQEYWKSEFSKDSIFISENSLFYYSNLHLDSVLKNITKINYDKVINGKHTLENCTEHIYYDKQGNNKYNKVDDKIYNTEMKTCFSDSVQMKIIHYPQLTLDLAKKYPQINPSTDDTTKNYYDNENRIWKTIAFNGRMTTTFVYKKDTIIINDQYKNSNTYHRKVYCFKNNLLIKIVWYMTEILPLTNKTQVEEFYYENNLPTKIKTTSYSLKSHTTHLTKIKITKSQDKFKQKENNNR